MHMMQVSDWWGQVPAAAAVVTVVAVFLRYMRSQSSETMARIRDLGNECHLAQEKVARETTAQIERVCGTFEKTLEKIANQKQ